MLKEAKRLYDAGFAVHWIKPKSKAPVNARWTTGPREKWDALKRQYKPDYGLGVRMGEASKLKNGYLANIDIDIKSSDPRHRKEALSYIKKRFPGLLKKAPWVKTGYGYRLFICTTKPLQSGRLTSSNETVKVKLPTTKISGPQKSVLTEEELAKGWRVRPAWEIDFMSIGRQVVLPPSIHPETGVPYVWGRELSLQTPLPVLDIKVGDKTRGTGQAEKTAEPFRPIDVDLDLVPDLSPKIVAMIRDGEGVEDRSAMLLPVACALCEAGLSDNEILTILTEREYTLGETAYDHTKSGSRSTAAEWIRKYTLRKARKETDAKAVFDEVVEVTENGEKKQVKLRLDKTEKGGIKHTVKNVVTILTKLVAPNIFRRDIFAIRDIYGCNTPWGGIKGEALTDDDAIHIKFWLSENLNFEPSTSTIFDAEIEIAASNEFHPIRDRFATLPPWDGTSRLDSWLKQNFGAKGNDEYLGQVFRKWMVASVTRIYEPGAKFDWIPILEGNQGIGKSSFGTLLFGPEYFCDWLPDLSDKDAALQLQGKQCVEFGELHSLRRSELEAAKAFITRQIDKVRPPYGRRSIESPRQVVFFGTTDKETYLRDDAGNRRFNPVRVGKLDFDVLQKERDQLWAEALFIYQNQLEPSLYLEDVAATYARLIQKEKMVQDESAFMALDIEKSMTNGGDFDFTKFKLLDLFGDFGPLQKWKETSTNIQLAVKALKALGFSSVKIKGLKWWKKG